MAKYNDYKSSKVKKSTNKRKVGTYPTVNVKSSDYLPNAFQTRINKQWMDSTFDQLVSKGMLEDIDAFVGSKSGKYRTETEQVKYLDTGNDNVQLTPGIVSDTRITFDDVAQAVEQYFDDYNYNSAYATQSYVYKPPINVDKFLNFTSYYWVPNLPVYESDNTNGTGTYVSDPITDINGKVTHTFIDDNNSFELEDGMRIKLELGYGALNNNIYLVTGVGKQISLRLYQEQRSGRGYPIWTDENMYTNHTKGYWDSLDVIDITYKNAGLADIRGTDPNFIRGAYNSDKQDPNTNTAPALWFYADNNRKVYMSDGMVIRFGTSWPNMTLKQQHEYYWVRIDASGFVQFDTIIEATVTAGAITQNIVTTNRTPEQIEKAQSFLEHSYDSNTNWDTWYTPTALKDYIVIDRDDPIASAWSRSNHWIHRDTIFKIASMDDAMDAALFTTVDNQAKRPIIEFEAGLHLMDHGNDDEFQTAIYRGPVDFLINDAALATQIQNGNTYHVLNTNTILTRDSNQASDPVYVTLNEGDTFIVRNCLGTTATETTALYDKWVRKDLWVNQYTKTMRGYVKTRVNHPPLYYLYDDERMNTRLDDPTKYPNSTFTYSKDNNYNETGGCKIFAYKVGTGTTIDPELDMVVSLKDMGHKAEYEFVNHQDSDRFTYNVITPDGGLVDTDTIKGYYSYKQNGVVKNSYVPANVLRGAKEKYQHIVTDGSVAQVIPIGSNNFKSTRDFFVHHYGMINDFTVTENHSAGIFNERKEGKPTLTVKAGETYKFVNLSKSAINFYSDFAGTAYTTNVTTSGNTTTITMPSSAGILYYGFSSTNKARIVILDNDDYLYHDLYIDGKRIRQEQYNISATEITVPANLVNTNSIIDLEFRDTDATNDTKVYSIPDVLEHNATNQQLLEFTISETFEHWNDIIYKSPNLQGQSFGINDYHKSVKLNNTGGTIFMYDDINIMHDYTYANTAFDIRDALFAQARDFTGFRKRFKSQVIRLYKTNTYTKTKDIVRDALKAITETKKGTDLYATSNMVYFQDNRELRYNLTSSQTRVYPSVSINTDFVAMDHAYVYLSENDGNNNYYERLLVKDVDYTLQGSKITLTNFATAVSSTEPAYITIQFIDRENSSYIPESMVKLGLFYGTPPTVETNLITLHDGEELTRDGTKDLYTPTNSNYDVVNACLLDLDKRIWAGIVASPSDFTRSPNAFLPAPHYETWYTKEKLDNYTEQLYRDWSAKNNLDFYNFPGYYDAADSTTWNYSTMGDWPGHWKGAYQYIFGTHRPDLTPWHMLGKSKKPDWWDNVYSWTDPTKRTALIEALTNGYVINTYVHTMASKTELRYARHNWDWTNKCPVDTNGNLVARELVLGTPAAVDRGQDFVFGDYGPIEIEWRRSALGQSALLDAIVKLLPASGWTQFFQPGLFNEGNIFSSNKLVNRYTRSSISPLNILYNNEAKNSKVKRIVVRSSSTGWGSTTKIGLFSPTDDARTGMAEVDVDATGKISSITITEGTFGYIDNPIFDITNQGTGYNQDAIVDLEFIMGDAVYDGHGLNRVLDNNLQRGYKDIIMKEIYDPIDTKLIQKVGGFTSENLVDFYTESGANGKYKVDTNDYNVFLYKGPPRKLCNASVMKLKKTSQGIEVDGYGQGKQKFYFYEPLKKNDNFVNVELVENAVVKRYNDFDYSRLSSIEYGASVARVQDLYDLIRGYYEYLKYNGIETSSNANAQASIGAIFAIEGQNQQEEKLNIGDTITYTGTTGRLAEFGTLPGGMNSILDTQGKIINPRDYVVDRLQKSAIIKIKDTVAKEFGSVTIAEIDFEHVVEFDNTTQFNDTVFNDVTNQRHHRLKMQGHRTIDWDGNTRAPGYLVFENKIVENFDTSVETINTLYDYNIENVNPTYRKAQNITIGNYTKDWVNNTFINDQTFGKFYQGLIKAKGTSNVLKPYNRSSMLNEGTSIASIHEEWMFRHSYYGDNTNVNATEIRLSPDPENPTLVDNNIEVLDITSDDIEYVNGTNAIRFNTETMAVFLDRPTNYGSRVSRTLRLKTAGEVLDELENDRNIVKTLPDMKSIYDSTAEYATIPTWDGTTSYKRGDKVRYKGRLVQCNVASIGFDTQASGLTFTGTAIEPVFNYVTQAGSDEASAIIDGTPIWFDETQTQFNNVTATANVVANIPSGSVLGIADTGGNGYNRSLTLNNVVLTTVINTTGDASINFIDQGNPFAICQLSSTSDPVIADNTGENLVINGATINLVTATYPAGTALTKANIAGIISATADTNLSAQVLNGNIVIIYDAQGNVNTNLVIGSGTANNDLSLVAGTYRPTTIQTNQSQNMDNATLVAKINAHPDKPGDISASVSGGFVVITKTPTSNSSTTSTLTLSNTVATTLFPAGQLQQTMTGSQVAISPQTVQNARDSINNANISGVTASVDSNNRLVITSTNNSIDLGGVSPARDMNTRAGLPTGIKTTQATVVANTFDASDWLDISDSDPALFKIQVVQDDNPDNVDGVVSGPNAIVSGIGSNAIPTSTQSVFNGWNVFQVQNLGLYSEIVDENGTVTTECSICAGTATEDGNDACVNVNVDHNLEVGDYVMIVNSTSIPSVDGIHKVTSLGTVGEPRKFFIDMFIEQCGNAPQVYVLRNCRFDDYNDILKTNVNNKDIDQSLNNIGNAVDQIANNAQYVVGTAGLGDGRFNWKSGDTVWSNYHLNNTPSNRGTYVYTHNGTEFVYDSDRSVIDRAVGKDTLSRAIIYDGSKNGRVTELELEVFDPVLGQVPGIANAQIDFKAFVDAAGYTNSTDINEPILLNTSTAWGEAELGKVWWDLTNAIYYDYSQGSAEYKRDYYGKLWEGGSIDVYEWSKSTVPPDEYEAVQVNQSLVKVDITNTPVTGAVTEFADIPSNLEMFGDVATGEPYSIVDKNSGEKIYYYTEGEDYNSKTNTYDKVYYFWVKNKTTYRNMPGRSLPVKNIAEIIANPTASGISWIAPISDTEILLANTQYVTDHKSVLQINKTLSKASHNSWTVLQEGKGLIPEYWYRGLLDNLTGFQASSGVAFPNTNLHIYNRFGDDRDLGQGWFYNTNMARREALDCVNTHLANINLIQDLEGKWDRTIGVGKEVIDIDVDFTNLNDWEPNTAYTAGTKVKWNKQIYFARVDHTSGTSSYQAFSNNQTWFRYASIYDFTEMWDYADYSIVGRKTNEQPTQALSNKLELATVDKTKHQIVSVSIQDPDGFDRSEILKWDGTDWVLQHKKNGTIRFAEWLVDSNRIDAWDKNNWDSLAWDGNKQVYWHYLVYALRHDIFIERHVDNFNKFFFCMVRHVLATEKQVDWCHKTTYIQLDITTPASTTANKYRKGNVNSLLGYINDVKPFHTKIRNIVDATTVLEDAPISISETITSDSTIKLNQFSVNVEGNDYENADLKANTYGNDILTSTFGTSTFTDTYTSQAFTDTSTPADIVSGGDFIDPELYNYTGDGNNRNSLAQLDTAEDLTITVQTNTSGSTVDTDSRTFVYRQDGKLNAFVDVLEQANSTTTTADITNIDTTIPVTSSANFNKSGGFAYINGEVIEYGTADNNTITVVHRGYASQKAHASGSTIVDITDAGVWNGTIKGVKDTSTNEYVDDNKINDIAYNSGTTEWEATSILSGTGLLSARLQSGTQGIDL